ncbi:MAG: hypothetical protein ABH864_06495 [archaeon]
MTDVPGIVRLHKAGLGRGQIASELGIDSSTVLVYLRREGLVPRRSDDFSRFVVEAHLEGLSHAEIAGRVGRHVSTVKLILSEEGLTRPTPEVGRKVSPESLEERVEFLSERGLGSVVAGGFGIPKSLGVVGTMKGSYDFFVGLGADPVKIYRPHPSLVVRSVSSLRANLDFLRDEVGVPLRRVLQLPSLFTYSLGYLRGAVEHYTGLFGDSGRAKKMLRHTPNIFGSSTKSIDRKIRVLGDAGIDFHKNYNLLVQRPEKVIDTKIYLRDELGVEESDLSRSSYPMLMGTDRDFLKPKVEYCNEEGIKWAKRPGILVLGLGTKEEPGALVRRVELIKSAFGSESLPYMVDYRNRPAILGLTDKALERRIKRYS